MALYQTEQDSLDTRVALPLLTYVRLFSKGGRARCALILVRKVDKNFSQRSLCNCLLQRCDQNSFFCVCIKVMLMFSTLEQLTARLKGFKRPGG